MTNLEDMSHDTNGTWEVREDGIHSNAIGKVILSCILSQVVRILSMQQMLLLNKTAVQQLLFLEVTTIAITKNMYAVNVDIGGHKAKFWRWVDNKDIQLIDERDVVPTADNRYTLKVVAVNNWISYYVNDVLMASTGDYVLQKADKGQNTVIPEGHFGLLIGMAIWFSKIQNLPYWMIQQLR